jgi:hypothetical protein
LKVWLGSIIPPKTELLYRASRDGFKASNFHEFCDSKSPTLILIKSEHNQIFGGYTTQPWIFPQTGKGLNDSKAFIFSLAHMTKHELKNKQDKCAIY